MNRGSGRRLVFRDDLDRVIFLELLSVVNDRFDVEVHTYCLMGNHFHLLLRSRSGRLSEAMQWLSGNFTKQANARRGVDGSIFRGRFHSVPVLDDAHARYLVRYINANPIDLGFERPLVDYRWSGLAELAGRRRASGWLVRSVILGWFDDDVERLMTFVEAASGSTQPIDVDETRLELIADAPEALEGIAAASELAWALSGGTLRRDALRLLVVFVAIDVVGVDRAEVCCWAGIGTSTLRSALSRARARVASNPTFSIAATRTVEALRCVSETQRNGSVAGHV